MTIKPECIGTIKINAGDYTDRGFECAAWSQTIRLEEQRVPVYMRRSSTGRPDAMYWGAEGIVTDAHFASYFCGVRVSNRDPAGDSAIGSTRKYSFCSYAFNVPTLIEKTGLQLDPGYEWLADQTTWDRHAADYTLQRAIRSNHSWRLLGREVNVNWLRKHGSPELLAAIRD